MQRIANLWKSSLGGKIVIIILALFTSCCACAGLGSLLPKPEQTATPTILETSVVLPTSTETLTPTIAFTPMMSFKQVSLEDFPRVASSRFKTLQENTAELVKIHGELTADINHSTNNDWYFHATAILSAVTFGADELASMTNYPPEYEGFHQKMLLISQEGKALFSNYMLALDHQDTNALSNATANLTNMITYLNDANIAITGAMPTATLQPTATIVFVQPTAATVSYDSNGDGKVTCADFRTQAAAQKAYNAGYTNLDGNDNDGKACETLP